MSLVQLTDIFYRRQRRVFLLVAAAVFLAAAAVTLTLPKEYRGVSTLFVGENRPLSAGADAVQLDDVLARTYAELLTTAALQRQVAASLPGTTPDQLEKKVSVEVVPATRLLEISALDRDPRRAQALANTYAKVFVEAQQTSLSAASRGRLQRLERRIGALAEELNALENRPAGETAGRRAQIENELQALRQSFASTQESSALQGSNVSISSLSTVPPAPAKPRTKLLLALGALVALLLGAVAALVRNAFDKRVRDEDELTKLMGVPILARVPFGGSDRDNRAMNEAFDFLRVNLRLSAADEPARVLAVTSSLPGDGKSTVCQRLAQAFAQQGAEVVAADCDLRKPMLASYLGVRQPQGVTNVLVARSSPVDLLAPSNARGIQVLPSGPVPPNPSVLLGLPRFGQIIEELRAVADYVVVDTPPVPAGVDTSAISQVVDGVILVIDLNRSNREVLAATRDQLEKTNSRVLGIVLNRVPDRLAQYGYGSDYEAPSADAPLSAAPPSTSRAPARAK
ncbi:MAG: polysaccharide biosynthesis tyrosine autokinase [Actinomycetota bacterium]|nr:polysaccharide biosynthesis tyrosine autokinase [Actinomycetota bacterium]